MNPHSRAPLLAVIAVLAPAAFFVLAGTAAAQNWRSEWPNTDFSRHSVDFAEIMSGGPPKDGIPAIDDPVVKPLDAFDDDAFADGAIGPREPVISVAVGDDIRAYPLRILMFHEIVNDVIGGIPVAITYCPLCNSAIVFDRRHAGQVLDFGTTGKLRNSDLVMYDRQTESWWQQFLGEAIIGELTGARLRILPSRIESFERFKARAPKGKMLAAPSGWRADRYGRNPYAGSDSDPRKRPFLYLGRLPPGLAPLERVVSVGKEAWSFALLRKKRRVTAGDLVITWSPGQNSALDSGVIARGRDVGNVVVQRRGAGGLADAVHDVSFAFAFFAFHPDGVIHSE